VQNFFDFTLTELEGAIAALGNEKYRARQLFQWVYSRGIGDFAEMTNIPKSLRVIFADMFSTAGMKVEETVVSSDDSIKFGFLTDDGYVVESVFMPEEERNTLCVSTQIGCRMGCRFCVTGKIGFRRNLSVAEIVEQIVGVKRAMGERRISNVVFMGMGEPIENLENVLHALDIMKDPMGLDISHRRITVSSVGLIDGLNYIGPKVANIAISLNAADDEKRNFLMPINRMYPIRELIRFVKGFKGTRRTRITFEYVLIGGFNDSLDDAKALAGILKEVRCKINLIPYNESPYIDFKAPTPEAVQAFQGYLIDRYFTAIVRDSRARDVDGGCGQLGIRYLKDKDRSGGVFPQGE
jgi:23S rRNA (adenine2503-C2)-methyltransferase